MRLMCALPCAQISAVRLGRIDSVVRVGRAARRLGHPRSGKHRAACSPGCDKAPHGGRGAGCGRSLLGGVHSRSAGLAQAVQLAPFVSVLVHPRSEGITRPGTRPMSKGPGSVRRAVPAGHRHSRLCILSPAPCDDIGRAHARLVLRADGGDLHRAGRGDPCGSRGAGYCPPPPAAPRRPIAARRPSHPSLVAPPRPAHQHGLPLSPRRPCALLCIFAPQIAHREARHGARQEAVLTVSSLGAATVIGDGQLEAPAGR